MPATKVDLQLVHAVLSTEIELQALESGRTEEILMLMRRAGIRRYGDLVQRPTTHVHTLVGDEAMYQIWTLIKSFREHNIPLAFGMDVEEYEWDGR